MTTETTADTTAPTPVLGQAPFQATAAAALLILAAMLLTVGNGALLDFATAGLTLINGPLVDGPLLDLGNTLSDLQIGQFQQ
ncbi:hypothetical protein [Nesterenkonia halotolerans]|uniref:Uncharacterized protein n=1 Tax=Nesterenkonia halotolerans TaxID=225325 RepID=A0ABR9J6V9_9MICC|nr:hypothetical protein [Nesterenkonia halotolerans]MBE1514728.1 hypothetical protein [Nesterenkonia halotolerans]